MFRLLPAATGASSAPLIVYRYYTDDLLDLSESTESINVSESVESITIDDSVDPLILADDREGLPVDSDGGEITITEESDIICGH